MWIYLYFFFKSQQQQQPQKKKKQTGGFHLPPRAKPSPTCTQDNKDATSVSPPGSTRRVWPLVSHHLSRLWATQMKTGVDTAGYPLNWASHGGFPQCGPNTGDQLRLLPLRRGGWQGSRVPEYLIFPRHPFTTLLAFQTKSKHISENEVGVCLWYPPTSCDNLYIF